MRREVGPPGTGPEPHVPSGAPESRGGSGGGGEGGGGPRLPPSMAAFLRRGVLLYPLVVVGLWGFAELGIWNALFLGALLELLPVLAVAQVPLAVEEQVERPAAYAASAATVLILGWIALALGEGRVGLAAMGMEPLSLRELLVWTGAGTAGGLVLVGAFHLVEESMGLETPPLLRKLLPRTSYEKSLFAGVSLAAGLGEELAYRGYAIPVVAGLVGSEWGAAVLTSGIFGFLHAYQGQVGVVRTALMGLVLAAVFLLSGSLWPAILAHVIIDLVGGLVVGPRFLDDEM